MLTHDLSLRLLEGEWYLLITSDPANQHAGKVWFTCVVYTNYGDYVLEIFFNCIKFIIISNPRYQHPAILANLISRPDTVHQSIPLFANQVNPSGDCSDYITQSFCDITSFLLPWFAAQSRTDPSDLRDSNGKQVAQATKSHAFLISILTQDVSTVYSFL